MVDAPLSWEPSATIVALPEPKAIWSRCSSAVPPSRLAQARAPVLPLKRASQMSSRPTLVNDVPATLVVPQNVEPTTTKPDESVSTRGGASAPDQPIVLIHLGTPLLSSATTNWSETPTGETVVPATVIVAPKLPVTYRLPELSIAIRPECSMPGPPIGRTQPTLPSGFSLTTTTSMVAVEKTV